MYTTITLRYTTICAQPHVYDPRAHGADLCSSYAVSVASALTLQNVHNEDLCLDAATLSADSVPGDAGGRRPEKAITSNQRHLRPVTMIASGALLARLVM